jgi:hypothetical protein
LAAGDSRSEDDFVAGVNALDEGADSGDFAGNVAGGHEREGKRDAIEAAANPKVEVV